MTAMYTIGMEEEYFVFDAKTRRAVRRIDKKFLADIRKQLGERVMTEMLQSQIEVATPPCETMGEAREHLTHFRRALGEAARERKLGLAAMGTFPLAFWPEQTMTPKARYDAIMDDLQMIGYRNMLCGMHVHVEVPDLDTRINLIMRLTPYLPLLLALSTSSPFWQGHLTGLCGYRLAAYDELPRTGLPELFRTNDDYNEFVAALVWAKIIPDASYIWWAMRPSLAKPDHRIARRRQLHAARRRAGDRRPVPLPGARARPRPRAQCRLRPGRPRHHAREQVACPALRHRRHLRRSVRPLAAHRQGMARPGARFHRRGRRRARLRGAKSSAWPRSSPRAPAPTARSTSSPKPRPPAAKKVNGDQGGHRLGGGRNQRRLVPRRLKAERRPGFPLPPRPPIKRHASTRISSERASPPGSPWLKPSTSSTAPI